MTPPVRRHVVLIGLPGAGKTVVGQRLAEVLHAHFTDLDMAIVAQAGMPVARIFAEPGEATFRRLEREAMATALGEVPQVIAAGGGWAAEPGNLDALGDSALVVHLRVSPPVAAGRLGSDHGRPLLAPDLLPRLEALQASRAPWYERASIAVDTDGLTPDAVARLVAAQARRLAGWQWEEDSKGLED